MRFRKGGQKEGRLEPLASARTRGPPSHRRQPGRDGVTTVSPMSTPVSSGSWAGRRMLILASATIEADRADYAGPAA
jgi:hypothetical protein